MVDVVDSYLRKTHGKSEVAVDKGQLVNCQDDFKTVDCKLLNEHALFG